MPRQARKKSESGIYPYYNSKTKQRDEDYERKE